MITRRDITDFEQKDLYLRRWSFWLPGGWSIKLHRIVRPDADRCLHCHPWPFLRIVLSGGYIEKTDRGYRTILPWRPWAFWRVYPCKANFKHRITELIKSENWSLIICGPKIREWGFFTSLGWRHWSEFVGSAKVNWCDGETIMPTVYDRGTNDADYQVTKKENGKQIWVCPFYSTWRNMLKRCYSGSDPTYKSCEVCPSWLLFMNFKSWMKSQDWEGNQLDKDLLGSGKLYSPKTCCFLPHKINSLLSEKVDNNSLPPGVHRRSDTGKLSVQCADFSGKTVSIGCFDTVSEAKLARESFKKRVLLQHAKTLPKKLKKALIRRI